MLILTWLLACLPEEPGRGVYSAEAAACLSGPLLFTEGDEAADLEVQATAVEYGAVGDQVFEHGVRCDHAMRRMVLDDGTNEWVLGWGWSDGGLDQTPEIEVTPGATVDLTFRVARTFGDSAGFVVVQRGLLMAALEVGTYGPALLGSDVPGVRASEGLVTGSEQDDCGRKVAREVLFDADQDIALESVDSAPLSVDGNPTTAWALASWAWENPSCLDVSGELSWAVFR